MTKFLCIAFDDIGLEVGAPFTIEAENEAHAVAHVIERFLEATANTTFHRQIIFDCLAMEEPADAAIELNDTLIYVAGIALDFYVLSEIPDFENSGMLPTKEQVVH